MWASTASSGPAEEGVKGCDFDSIDMENLGSTYRTNIRKTVWYSLIYRQRILIEGYPMKLGPHSGYVFQVGVRTVILFQLVLVRGHPHEQGWC